jgi:hypothetical protein
LSLQSITDPSTHTKNGNSQGLDFAQSFEQRTENPRVGNPAITPVIMHSEGSDLIGGFFMSEGFVWKALFLSFCGQRGFKDVAFGYAFITMAQLRFCEE